MDRRLEKEIIKQLRDRQESGLEALLRHYGPLIRYIIAPILKDAREQEECISDVAMRVWDKITLFDEKKGSFTGWLTALTRNTALNRAKKVSVHESKLEASEEELTKTVASKEPGPEEQILRKESREKLQKVIQSLSAKDKALFYRKYYYMQSTAQIASEMGLTERAVEGKLYRLRQQLRGKLGGDLYG